MHTFFIPLSESIINALGWTIIHSIWQGLVIALLLFIFLNSFKKTTAQVKYRVATLALVLTFGLALTSFCLLWQSPSSQTMFTLDQSVAESDLIWVTNSEKQLSGTASKYQMLIQFINENINTIVWAWMAGVVIFTLRLLGAMTYLQKLKREAQLPDSDHWQEILNEMIDRLNFKKPSLLLTSTAINVPITLGYLKPVILFPVGVLNQLSLEEAESILAHEFAHIIRNDYLLNIIQSIIEALLYFNPGVWWISDVIRRERENSCDDIALSVSGNQIAYAKALVTLQEYELNAPPLAMGLITNKYRLLNRIRRILKQPQKNSSTMEKIIASSILCCFVLLFSVAANKPDVEVAQNSATNGSAFLIVQDSLPKGKVSLEITKNDSIISSRIENGTLKELSINGKKIATEELSKYENYVEDLIRGMSEPTFATTSLGGKMPDEQAFFEASGLGSSIFLMNKDGVETIALNEKVIRFFDENGKVVAKIFTKNGEEEELDIRLEDGGIVIAQGDTLIHGFKRFKVEKMTPFSFSGTLRSSAPWVYGFHRDSSKRQSGGTTHPFVYKWGEDEGNTIIGNGYVFSFSDTLPDGIILNKDKLVFPEEMDFGLNTDTLGSNFYFWKDSVGSLEKIRQKHEAVRRNMLRHQEQIRQHSEAIQKERRAQQERIRQHSEAIQKERRAQQERIRQHSEAIQKERRARQEQIRRRSEAIQKEQKALSAYSPRKALEEAMIEDGFIKDRNSYNLDWKLNRFRINGKKVNYTEALKSKYRRLIERFVGQTIKEKTRVRINVVDGERFRFSIKD